MLDDNNNGNPSPTEQVNEEKLNDYQKRKLVNARRRKLNKKAKTVEDLITKHEREKQAIIKDFEINPVFSKERNECLAKVTKLLGEQETKWIALQEELEQLGAEI